jgi:DNA end-binding protein Ku
LEAVVQAKIEGNEIVRPAGELPEPKAAPADLSEILRASVAALKAERDQADGSRKADGARKADGSPPKSTARTGSGSPAKAETGDKDDQDDKDKAAKPASRRKRSA